jgi:hypothetical protein
VAVVVVRVIMEVIVTMPGAISMHVLVLVGMIVMMRMSAAVAGGMRMRV